MICALAMNLIRGCTGMLSLGQGVFFAVGGSAMGVYLMPEIGRDGNCKSELRHFVLNPWPPLDDPSPCG